MLPIEVDLIGDLSLLWTLYKKYKNYKKYKKCKKYKSKKQNSGTKKRRHNKTTTRTRDAHGYFTATFLRIKEIDGDEFFQHTRMIRPTFSLLLEMLKPHLEKVSIRKPLSPECRLALTLLFLSQGCSMQSLACSWKVGKETVRTVIYETCNTLWTILSQFYVTEPNGDELKNISKDFWQMLDMPNCIGAIDGKHIALSRPPNIAGAEFFNYKKFCGMVLLAACDARYRFTYVDVGGYGWQSDVGIFQSSILGKRLLKRELHIPEPAKLPNSQMVLPHFFVANQAFPLDKNIMKPFHGCSLPRAKKFYNKRLSRARRIIENSFGILVARWRVLQTTLHMFPKNAEKIVLACVALHNFLCLNDESSKVYNPPKYVDWEDTNNITHEGLWRMEINLNLLPIASSQNRHRYGGQYSSAVREDLCRYLNESFN